MKISCKIIEDLLPLYIDEVCSEESKKLIEEHLSECSQCNEKLNRMKLGYVPEQEREQNLAEAEFMRNLSKKWNKKLLFATLKGIISTLIFVVVILLIMYLFIDIRIV
ncbi:hypothetical protein PEPCOX59622_00444 [Aedoeadaptatus coxii]|uniref:zf-HC2 domain-containing protein n=1 Tax=Aedoeadaptatus coxii TaxID=755172 RepID=UPI00175369F5|nr:zf-HC2 domain-containing protein [Peptoniphilus coxii]CAC9928828.1 hypothetical protein PEPCOX59622_00444 [Peptoniphilus coxii]